MMYFFKKLCRTLISPLIPQFVNSWWGLPALLRPVWIPHSSDTLLSATHADFLAVSVATDPLIHLLFIDLFRELCIFTTRNEVGARLCFYTYL